MPNVKLKLKLLLLSYMLHDEWKKFDFFIIQNSYSKMPIFSILPQICPNNNVFKIIAFKQQQSRLHRK